MKKFFFIILVVPLFFALNACDDDDNGRVYYQFENLEIVEAELPESFELGRRYEILVTFVRPDACTYFQGFDVYPQDTTVRNVTAIGWVNTDRVCTQQITEVTDSFIFRVIYDQTYTFRFWQGVDADGDPEFLEIDVPVVDN